MLRYSQRFLHVPRANAAASHGITFNGQNVPWQQQQQQLFCYDVRTSNAASGNNNSNTSNDSSNSYNSGHNRTGDFRGKKKFNYFGNNGKRDVVGRGGKSKMNDDGSFFSPEKTVPVPVMHSASGEQFKTRGTDGHYYSNKKKQHGLDKGMALNKRQGASGKEHQNLQKKKKRKWNKSMQQQEKPQQPLSAEQKKQHNSSKQHAKHKDGAAIAARKRSNSSQSETVRSPLGFDRQKSRQLQSSFFNAPATDTIGDMSAVDSSKTIDEGYFKYRFGYVPNLDVSFTKSARIPHSPVLKQTKKCNLEKSDTMPSFLPQVVAEKNVNDRMSGLKKQKNKKNVSKPSKSSDTSPLRLFPKIAATTSRLGGMIYRHNISQLTQDVIMSALPQDLRKSGSHSNRKRFQKLDANDDPFVIDTEDQPPIALLSHNLERTLHSPGVHTIYNHESDDYNFPPFLRRIHQPEEIDFRAITPFITTSKDTQLHSLAKQHKCSYKGSTSSLSGALTPLYMLLSNFRPPASRALPSFQDMTSVFTPATRKPNSIVIRPHPMDSHIYSIDSWKPPIPSGNKILMDLGKTLERMLTMDAEEYMKQFVKNPTLNQMRDDEFKYEPEAYTYMKLGKIMARSQLDCEWKDPQGNKGTVFDIKTRAINPVRINMQDYEKYTDHVIHSVNGITNSYEREFYDMVRSVFIKYSFQARIGNMDGMFVGYHNTKEMFGFEYIPLEEIDTYVFGSSHMGERALVHSTKLLETICDTLTECHPGVALKTTLWVKKIDPYFMDIFVEPMPNDEGWSEESGDSWDVLKQQFNPFGLNEEVYCYRLAVEVYVNGKLATSYVDFSPEDKVEVSYNLQLRATNKTDPYLFTEYQDVIKRSAFLR